MEERELLIRSALRELEPDEGRWKHFGVLVIPAAACAEVAVKEYLKRCPRPFPVPAEALSYTVRYLGGDKVVFVDLRRLDSLRVAVDSLFPNSGRALRPEGFFRA